MIKKKQHQSIITFAKVSTSKLTEIFLFKFFGIFLHNEHNAKN